MATSVVKPIVHMLWSLLVAPLSQLLLGSSQYLSASDRRGFCRVKIMARLSLLFRIKMSW